MDNQIQIVVLTKTNQMQHMIEVVQIHLLSPIYSLLMQRAWQHCNLKLRTATIQTNGRTHKAILQETIKICQVRQRMAAGVPACHRITTQH